MNGDKFQRRDCLDSNQNRKKEAKVIVNVISFSKTQAAVFHIIGNGQVHGG